VDAGDGDDRVLFGGGETAPHARLGQRASGGPGDDRIEASDGPFGLSGDAGADVLAGGSGRGTVTGGSGGDRLAGGAGDDVLVGDGPGAGAADDVIDGRGGSDTVSYAERADAVRVDLAAGAGGASGERDAVAGVEDVRGGSGGGVLLGDDGPNTLRAGGSRRANSYVIAGRGGDDVIFGSAAADRLSGGDGGDRIAGGDGDDLIRAGAGADRIVASDAARADCGSGHDTADLGEGVQAAACERVELEAADVSVPTLMRSGRALRLRVAPQGAACAVRVLVLEGNRTYPPVRDADAGEPYSNLGRTSFALAHPQRAALTVRLNALGRRSLARKPRRLLRLALVPSRRCSRGPIGARELEANTFLFRLAPHS
jgi:Ca2+-binding RTX toxin-like protein